jgi:carbamoyltransferase
VFILGLNAYHGNASAALFRDGELLAAVEEERLNRVKYAAGFPALAVRSCLEQAGIGLGEVDHVAVPRDPWARLGTKLWHALKLPGFAMDRARAHVRFTGLAEELAEAGRIPLGRLRARFHRVEHHRAHAASSFFLSPFREAAVLSADGLGDFGSALWGTGRGEKLSAGGSVAFPHSLGLFYTAITQYLGFWKFGDEFKVMGLAAYGEPAYLDEFRKIIRGGNGLAFRLDLDYFLHHRRGCEMTWRDAGRTPELGRLFSGFLEERLGPARGPEEPVGKRHRDLAASLQARLEEVLMGMLGSLQKETRQKNLCLAGGVAFNCVANGKIPDSTPFEKIYVHPAAGDAGLAVGAAAYVYHHRLGRPRRFVMDHAYWGPSFGPERIRRAFGSADTPCSSVNDENRLCKETARALASGKIVGWFQGRMEWGPRALGNRSILADPRRVGMKDVLNARVKHRETFRPFAPSVLAEAVPDFFERSHPSPFMNMAYGVLPEKRGVIPAPTHVDGTARLQTVEKRANPRYWKLIKAFQEETGVPALLNTSFNDNEPIVCTPEEAVDCFQRTQMDVLVMGDFTAEKK